MPIHDWSRVDAGLFHAFHQSWSVALQNALNDGRLPEDYFALVEKRFQDTEPDVLTLRSPTDSQEGENEPPSGGIATVVRAPSTRFTHKSDANRYAEKANVIRVYRRRTEVVAVIEIVSPGNKKGNQSFEVFKQKNIAYLLGGVNLVIVDLIPPTKRDPRGIHGAIWEEFSDDFYVPPADKPLTLVSYEAGLAPTAYVEPIAVGDKLQEMPVFLCEGYYVPLPLDDTYTATWNHYPKSYRRLVESPGR